MTPPAGRLVRRLARLLSVAAVGTMIGSAIVGMVPLSNSSASVPPAPNANAAGIAAPSGTDPASSPALSELKTCLAQKQRGDLLLLIDTSRSLVVGDEQAEASDPTAVRVDAATLLLTRLSDSLAQKKISLDVAIAGFDADTSMVVDFTPLTAEQLPGIDAQVASFADRTSGQETDYWNALTWVNGTLQAKQQSRGNLPACQLAIWFTDGQFSLSPNGAVEAPEVPGFESTVLSDAATADAVQAAAAKELCRVGGPADQMRLAGTTLIAVGLGGQAADYNQENFSLQNYAENPNLSCGAQPGRGLFIPALSPMDLVLAFDAVLGDNPVRPDSKGLCAQVSCPSGTYDVPLDDSLDVVHVAAVLDNKGKPMSTAGIAVQLAGPHGQTLVIAGDGQPGTGTGTVEGTTVAYEWYPRGELTLDLNRSDASWDGNWKLTFIDTTGTHPDAVSKIQLTLTSDLQIIPEVDQAQWRADQQSGQITFRPARLDGTPIDPAGLVTTGWKTEASLVYQGTATDQTTSPLPIPVDLNQPVTVPIPDYLHPGTWHVLVKLGVTMAGRPLPEIGRQVDVTINPPFGSPTLAPTDQSLDFGQIEGTTSATRTISVAGPTDGDGCVWVTDGTLGVTPPSVSTVTVGAGAGESANCLTVGAGQTADVQVSLAPGSPGNGPLSGEVEVHLAPAADPAKASVQSVGYHAELERLPNEPVKWAVLVLIMLLGIGIPVIVLILARRWVARFPQNALLQYALVDIQVGPDGLRGAGAVDLNSPSLGWISIGAPVRGGHELSLGAISLRAKAGWRFTEPGYAEIDQAGTVGVCGDPPHRDPRSGHALLPLAVEGTWTLLFSESAAASSTSPIAGQLLIIVATSTTDADRVRLAGIAVRDSPDLVDELRRTAASAARGGAHDPDEPATTAAGAANPFEGSPDPDSGFGLAGAGYDNPAGSGGFDTPSTGHATGFGANYSGPAGFESSGREPGPDGDDVSDSGFGSPFH